MAHRGSSGLRFSTCYCGSQSCTFVVTFSVGAFLPHIVNVRERSLALNVPCMAVIILTIACL